VEAYTASSICVCPFAESVVVSTGVCGIELRRHVREARSSAYVVLVSLLHKENEHHWTSNAHLARATRHVYMCCHPKVYIF